MANSQVAEIRVRFVRETPDGDLHDCIIYQLADFVTDPTNLKIGQAKVLSDIADRTANWQTQVQAAKLIPPPDPPTEDEIFQAKLDDLTDDQIAEFKVWLSDKADPKAVDSSAAMQAGDGKVK